MKFSFVILHHNQSEELTTQLIPSIIRAMDGYFDYDVAVIDDHSDDLDNLAQIESHNIRVLSCPVKRNQSMSRNMGVDATDGDYIMYIDGDDWYNPSALREVCRLITESPNHDVYYSRVAKTRGRASGRVVINQFRNEDTKRHITGTMQNCISRKYIDRIQLRWHEEKFNWDSEDYYYWMCAYGLTDNRVALDISGPVVYHPLYKGSNSDRTGERRTLYCLGMIEMGAAIRNKITEPKILSILNNTVGNWAEEYRWGIGYYNYPKQLKERIDLKLRELWGESL